MIVNAFYNKQGIGDTLLLSARGVTCLAYAFEKKGDVVQVYSQETKEICGYNIFNATSYFDIKTKENGKVKLTKDFLTQVNEVIEKAGFTKKIEADLAPKFVVGLVESKTKHPNADKLNVCIVDVGEEKLQIVCGAPNVEIGQKVVVAKVGALMPNGLLIEPTNLRGIDSFGMICAARELAIPEVSTKKGILVLDDARLPGELFVIEN